MVRDVVVGNAPNTNGQTHMVLDTVPLATITVGPTHFELDENAGGIHILME